MTTAPTDRRRAQLTWLVGEVRRLIADDPNSPGQGLRRGKLRLLKAELATLDSVEGPA